MNPAARKTFPDLLTRGAEHDALQGIAGMISGLEESGKESASREIEIGQRIYRETVHYLPEKKILRVYMEDITEQRKAEEAQRESERRLRMITENMMDTIAITDLTGVFQYASPSFKKVAGYSPEELIGKHALLFIHPADILKVTDVIRKHISAGSSGVTEFRARHADGRYVWVESAGDLLRDENGRLTGAVISGRDISDRKAVEEQLKVSLQEKEMLLKEVHHRVKNNLQVVSSMLNLQSAYVKDGRDLRIFRDCQSRVRSMALVHEKLYRSASLSEVDFDNYARSLIGIMYSTYSIRPDLVTFSVDAAGVLLDADSAVHCGLLINELISNSLKHAFPDGRKGKVWLQMRRDAEGIEMIAGDNGVGMPEGADVSGAGTLGMQLIDSLVMQLNGTLEMDRRGGTVYRIRFKDRRAQ